jgi:hypothetical protein
MEFNSFREVLVKKAQNDSVKKIVQNINDEYLVELVSESLSKMAFQKERRRSENGAVKAFASFINQEHVPDEAGETYSPTKEMMYDHLSHHVSHYKNAVQKGDQDTANQHARQIFDNVFLNKKLEIPTKGVVGMSVADVKPWERNKFLETVSEDDKSAQGGTKRVGQFKTNTRGFDYRGKDFSFLQQAPHESHAAEIKANNKDPQHEGQDFRHGYPFEHMKMAGKHVDVHPVEEDVSGYQPHFFDSHPIFSHFKEPPKNRSEERDAEFMQEHQKFVDEHAEPFAGYMEHLEEHRPDRGSARGESVHGEHPNPLDISGDIKGVKSRPRDGSKAIDVALDTSLSQDDRNSKLAEEYKAMGLNDDEIKTLIESTNRALS